MPLTPPAVLHVISSVDPRDGGATTQLAALVDVQRALGLDVRVVSTFRADFDPRVADRMRAAGAAVDLVGPSGRVLQWHPKIGAALRRAMGDCGVVHVHAAWEEIQHQAFALARRLSKPVVFSPHGMLTQWSMSQGGLKKRLYLALRLRRDINAAAAIHYTDAVERDLTAGLRLRAPAVVLPCVVDLDEFAALPPSGTFRSAHPQLGDAPYALFLSRIALQKNPELLLRAFARARPPGVRLVMAGEAGSPAYGQSVAALARSLGLADRVYFPGMLTGPMRAAAYAEARAFVLSSHQENFGIVVIEAAACGSPVLVSTGVNIHRHVASARVGEAIALDEAAWASALEHWLNDPARCAATGARAREWAFANYDKMTTGRAWVGVYERVMAKAGRGQVDVEKAIG